jgi:hypothetical protein
MNSTMLTYFIISALPSFGEYLQELQCVRVFILAALVVAAIAAAVVYILE